MIIWKRFQNALNMCLNFLITHTKPVVSNSVGQYLVSAFVKYRCKKNWVPDPVWWIFFYFFSRGIRLRLFFIDEMRLRQYTNIFLLHNELSKTVCWIHFATFWTTFFPFPKKCLFYKSGKMFFGHFFFGNPRNNNVLRVYNDSINYA